MNLPGKRLLLGSAVAVATLGVGGIAYAATNDPAPETGYVTIEDGTTPGNGSNSGPEGYGGPQGSGTEGSGTPNNGTAGRNGTDCPEKNGSGQSQGEGQGQGQQTPPSQPSQPQTQPSQPEQTQPSQPEQTQPSQQTPSDAAENA